MSILTAAQDELLGQLTALRQVVATTTTLASILDDSWFKTAEGKLRSCPTPGSLGVDPSGFFLGMCHPSRDVFIASLDSRLSAFRALPFKRHAVQTKLEQLQTSRSEPSFKNHLFEVGVLGDLALKGVLKDIDEDITAVDGVIDIGGQEILVEATNTVQEVIPSFTGVMFLDPNIQIEQVVEKIRKKVADGRQFALARGKPTVLFLALTRRGADRVAAEIALDESFRLPAFAGLSGVVLADSWRFHTTTWHRGAAPDTPLKDTECEKFSEWYMRR